MVDIVTTIPKNRYSSWEECEQDLKTCNGENPRWDVWLINVPRKPKTDQALHRCFMIYDGLIRGYFDVIFIDYAKNWYHFNRRREGYSIILANWHTIKYGQEMKGFQGWRYYKEQ